MNVEKKERMNFGFLKIMVFVLFAFALIIVVLSLNAEATNLETLVLRPDGTDDSLDVSGLQGASTYHEAVDEGTCDGNVTQIFSNASAGGSAWVTFTMDNHTVETGTVEEIMIVTEMYRLDTVYSHGEHYLNGYRGGWEKVIYASLVKHQWTTCASYWTNHIASDGSEAFWNWTLIDNLKVSIDFGRYHRLSQVYVVVKYVTATEMDVCVDDDYDESTPDWMDTNFSVIRDAVYVCADGGTVNISGGTYYLNATTQYASNWDSCIYPEYHVRIKDKAVNIVGNGVDSTILDNKKAGGVIEFSTESNGSSVSNLNITNYGDDYWGEITDGYYRFAIHGENCNNITVSNVNIYDIWGCDNIQSRTDGIYFENCQDILVENCVIVENNTPKANTQTALFIADSDRVTIKNNSIDCRVRALTVSGGDTHDDLLVQSNTVRTGMSSILDFIIACNVTIDSNCFCNTSENSGFHIQFSRGNFTNNIIENCTGAFGLNIYYPYDSIFSGNTIQNNNAIGIRFYRPKGTCYIHSNIIINNTDYGLQHTHRVEYETYSLIYNNYFDNTNNLQEGGYLLWNISKTLGTNIMGGLYLGGNYWNDYTGSDTDGDGLGETPFAIGSSYDYHPLTNTTPEFANLSVVPITGTEDTTNFCFSVSVWNTVGGDISGNVYINISRYTFYTNNSMIWVCGSNVTGANYTYSTTLPSPGVYLYECSAYDGNIWNQTSAYVEVTGGSGHYESIVHVSFYDTRTGFGMSPYLLKMYFSDDTTINEDDRIYFQEYYTYTGYIYYYKVTDFFDNTIYPTDSAYSSIVIDDYHVYLDIPITWYSFTVKNLNSTIMHFSMTNGSRNYNVTLFPMDPFYTNVLPGDYSIIKKYYSSKNGSLLYTLYDNISISDDGFYIASGFDAMVHVSWYNTNEGIGLPDETLKLYVDGVRQISQTYWTYINRTINITVKDYYNLTMYTGSHTLNSAYTFIDLGLTFHSWLFGNKNDDYYMISLLRQGGSRWWERGIVPYGEREFIIPSGYYILRLYDKDYIEVYNSTSYIPVINSKVFVIHGVNLTEIISGLSIIRGQLLELSDIIDYALTPDIEIVTLNPPMVFSIYDKEGMALGTNIYKICPALITIATTRVETTGNWINSTAMIPGNNTVTNGTVTILSDELFISGSNAINWVNITYTDNGTLYQNTTYVPSKINFYGQNLTITASGDIHILRETQYNQLKKFYWTYYSDTGKHTAGIDIINSMNVPMYDVYVYVEFSNQSTPDPTTVVMRDVSNTGVVLKSGEHYDITSVGIHFYLLSISSDSTRGFTFEYYKRFDDAYRYGEETINVPGYTETVWNGLSFNTFEIGWINDESTIFRGGLFVKLDFEESSDINPSSVRIWDENNNHELNESDFIFGNGFIRIDASGLGDINPGSGRKFSVYFLLKEYPGTNIEEIHLNTPLFIIGGFAVTPFLIIFILSAIFMGYSGYVYIYSNKKDWWKGVALGSFVLFIFSIMAYMGV